MGDFVQFVSRRLSESFAELLDALFHMEFWELLMGVVVLGLSAGVITTLPDNIRGRVKVVIFAALALIVTIEIFRPLNWTAVLG